MNLKLERITEEDLKQFKEDMQEAFQLGAIEGGYSFLHQCVWICCNSICARVTGRAW